MSDDKSYGGLGGGSTSEFAPAGYFRPAPTTKLPTGPAPGATLTGEPSTSVATPDDFGRTVLRPAVEVTPAALEKPVGGLLGAQSKRTRKARLRLARLDPWSVMKTVFLFSVAGAIMTMVAVGVTWTVIEGSGLLDDLNEMVSGIVSTPADPTPFDIKQFVNAPKVLGGTAVISAINIVLFTALGTLGSFLYNLSATMLGGLEVTLAED